jgi:hypothetical protein
MRSQRGRWERETLRRGRWERETMRRGRWERENNINERSLKYGYYNA